MSNILIKPVITEKSVANTANRFYSFFVNPKANKYLIKKAVKDAYKVEVESVRIVIIKPKSKRRGRHTGQTATAKKAIVKLAPDQKIEFFEKL
ncbi:MAG: 50S ribosomal protein L23 [Patescibacteria group bacterium]